MSSPTLRRLLGRLALAAALTFLCAVLPLPFWTPVWFAYYQVPLAVLLFVCYLGKLLYDTLFYERYR